MALRIFLVLVAVLSAPSWLLASPITAIGGAYGSVGPSGSGISNIVFSSGIVLNDAGAGSTLPFAAFASGGTLHLAGLPSNPGPAGTTPSSVTLTQGIHSATFNWTGLGNFQDNTDNTVSITFTGVTMTANTFPMANADLSLFNDSDNEFQITFQRVSLDSLSPGQVTVGSAAVGIFMLSSEPFKSPVVPEPATLLTLGLVGAAGTLYLRRKRV